MLTSTPRAIKMLADYVTGTPVAALAVAHGLSAPRVYQLLDKQLAAVGVVGGVTTFKYGRVTAAEVLQRLRLKVCAAPYRYWADAPAATPAEFYYGELLREPKKFIYHGES